MIEGLHEIIDWETNPQALRNGYIHRDGFTFTAGSISNIFDALVIRNPVTARGGFGAWAYSERTLDDHIQLVNENHLDRAIIVADDLEFITQCPGLKHLIIYPAAFAGPNFDYSPLYRMQSLASLCCYTEYGHPIPDFRPIHRTTLDYAQISGLSALTLDCGKSGHLHYNRLDSLKELIVSHFKSNSLTDLFCSPQLEVLKMTKCSVNCLDGIGQSKKLQTLWLDYDRTLTDVSELTSVKDTLREFVIQNCPKLTDFSCLAELGELEYLTLSGSNTLPDLTFLRNLKKLKFFTFSMTVADGDLMPCLAIPYARCDKGKKHYNLKDKDLPKNLLPRG